MICVQNTDFQDNLRSHGTRPRTTSYRPGELKYSQGNPENPCTESPTSNTTYRRIKGDTSSHPRRNGLLTFAHPRVTDFVLSASDTDVQALLVNTTAAPEV